MGDAAMGQRNEEKDGNTEKPKRKTNHRKDEFIRMTQDERDDRLAEILARGVLKVIGKEKK